MTIDEVVRSCIHEQVAIAAVRCIGPGLYADIKTAANANRMTPGAFTALAVQRFSRHADETETRAVHAAMKDAQEPILAGLHRILCIMLAAAARSGGFGRTQTRMNVHPAALQFTPTIRRNERAS